MARTSVAVYHVRALYGALYAFATVICSFLLRTDVTTTLVVDRVESLVSGESAFVSCCILISVLCVVCLGCWLVFVCLWVVSQQ